MGNDFCAYTFKIHDSTLKNLYPTGLDAKNRCHAHIILVLLAISLEMAKSALSQSSQLLTLPLSPVYPLTFWRTSIVIHIIITL